MVDTDNNGSISQSEFKTGCEKGWIQQPDAATATDMKTESKAEGEPTPQVSSPATDTKTEPPAAAEQTPQVPSPPPAEQSAASDAGTTPASKQTFATVSGDALLASDYYDQNVYDPQDNKIGKVQDILIAKDGKVIGVMLGVGGLLGLGEKNVAVPFDALKVVEKNNRKYLAMDATKESLEAAPGYSWDMTNKKWVPQKAG